MMQISLIRIGVSPIVSLLTDLPLALVFIPASGATLLGEHCQKEDSARDSHHYGTLTSLLRSLFSHGVRPDPQASPNIRCCYSAQSLG